MAQGQRLLSRFLDPVTRSGISDPQSGHSQQFKMAAKSRIPEVPPQWARCEEFPRKCIYVALPSWAQDLPGNIVLRTLAITRKCVLLSDQPEPAPIGTRKDAGKQSSYLEEGRALFLVKCSKVTKV